MKHEWRKNEKDLYNSKNMPRLINVPQRQYIMLNGQGNPNEADFKDKVSCLYNLAYSIKNIFKVYKQDNTDDIDDFVVYPLESIWHLKNNNNFNKQDLVYTIMICQPNFITQDIFNKALESVKTKKPNLLYDNIVFETIEGHTCVDILHIGSYNDEPISFKLIDDFIKENNLIKLENNHTEIYLSNPNRTKEDKLKTILRVKVK